MPKQEKQSRYTLNDIIREEAERLIAEKAISAPKSTGNDLGFLNISSIKDITELIREINRAAAIFKGNQQQVIREEPPAPVPQKLDYNKILDKVIEAFDAFIAIYGDIPLSEAKEKIIENKQEILTLMESQLAG